MHLPLHLLPFACINGAIKLRNIRFTSTLCASPAILGDSFPILSRFLHDSFNNHPIAIEQEPADMYNPSNPIRATFQTERAVEMWTSCCQRAVQCCQVMHDPHTDPITTSFSSSSSSSSSPFSSSFLASTSAESPTCPPTWDGWTCWHRSLPDQVALAPCPDYIYFETEPPACPREFLSIHNSLAISTTHHLVKYSSTIITSVHQQQQ